MTLVSNRSPEKIPELTDRTCHVWWADSDQATSMNVELLSSDEQRKRSSLPKPFDRDRFTVGRVLVRTVLSGLTGCPPAELRFSRICAYCGGPHGKPRLRLPGSQIFFNISHSGRLVVAAFARSADVGVDVEEIQPGFDASAAARFSCSDDEQSVLASLPDSARAPAFFRYWARKEAAVKATGEGLRRSLRLIEVGHPDHRPRLLAHTWRPAIAADAELLDLRPAPGYAAALCLLGPVDRVQTWDARTLLTAAPGLTRSFPHRAATVAY
ncbi:4'-phosphopantetheinyl transferase [Kitasatospora sp. GAS204A]